MKKILILEPYFGGSHKHFLKGIMDHVKAEYIVLSLPARKWKMRMQLSAQWFVEQLKSYPPARRHFDTVLCSTFVDVSVFRALTCTLNGWNASAKVCLYFHENQFAYPNRTDDKSLYQFTAINFNSALAADSIAFNSEFNRSSFLQGCRRYLKFASDMKFSGILDSMADNSIVLYPGVEFPENNHDTTRNSAQTPVIVWNHRWEHDKNPEEFFQGLRVLKDKGVGFQLIVLGQSFVNSPICFAECEREFRDQIIHIGFAESYSSYIELLQHGTVVVSTSLHEFYGISIIEAVRAGCLPLLPNRLSYPELFSKEYLYEEGEFFTCLEKVVRKDRRITGSEAVRLTEKFSWDAVEEQYVNWLLGV